MNTNDREFLVQKIRTQYTEKEQTSLDTLRQLDAKVKRPANIFAYILGALGAIIMGSGMSLVMTDLGTILGFENTMPVGIIIGIIGLILCIINYPVFKAILNSRRKKYADKIIALSDEIIRG